MVIEMPKGNYKPCKFKIKNKDKSDFNENVSEIYISCKKNTSDTSNLLFQKRLSRGEITKDNENYYHFAINPEDTENLPYEQYVLDILIYNESPLIKQTILGSLKITDIVTHKKDEG